MADMITIDVNGSRRECADGQTVAGLVAEMIEAGKRVAVELNGEVLPRKAHAAQRLRNGDCLEVVTAIGGG